MDSLLLEQIKGKGNNLYETYKSILFWGGFLLVTVMCSFIGFYLASFLEVTNFLGNFKELPDWVQQILSLDGKWVEALSNLFVPFFVVFSIKFYALEITASRKKWLFKALPFLPYLSFLSRTPILFIQGTASIFLGVIIYMMTNFGLNSAFLLVFPFIISGLSISIRNVALDNLSKVGPFTKKHKNKFGHLCIILAITCWVYANIITLFTELYLIFENLS